MNLNHSDSLSQYDHPDPAAHIWRQAFQRIEHRYQQQSQKLAWAEEENQRYSQESAFHLSLLDQVCNAIIATDLQGNILYWNDFAQRIYQWQAQEVIGQNIAMVLAPVDGRQVAKMVRGGVRAELWQGEVCVRRKDGASIWVEVKHSLLRDQDHQPIGFVGVSFDISERKLVETALEQQSQLLRSQADLLNLTHDSIMVFNLDGLITFWNHGAEQTYGWSQSEVLGQNIHHLLRTEGAKNSLTTIHADLLMQHRWEGELVHTRRDGSRIVVHSRQVLRLDDQDQPLEILEINNDISDRKQVETALQHAHDDLESRVEQRTQQLAQMNAILQAEIRDRQHTETALRQSEEALARRERFLTTLLSVQTRLLSHQDPDTLYHQVLEPLARVAGADHAYLYENQPNAVGQWVARRRYVWNSPLWARRAEVAPVDLPYQEVCPEWYEQLAQGQVINCPIADCPLPVRTHLADKGVQAIVLLPLMVQHKFWGFIGFDNGYRAQCWDNLEVNLLEAAASSLAMTLEHWLAEQLLQHQAECDRLLGAIALRIRESLDLHEILHRTAAEVRQFLQTDRVLIYRFDEKRGNLVAASVDPAWDISSGDATAQHHIWYRNADAVYEQGTTYVVHDIEAQGLAPDYLSFMHQLQVQAKLVVPIIQRQALPTPTKRGQPLLSPAWGALDGGQQLWGVLAIHSCATTRVWQPFEIDLVQKLAVQVAIAIQQAQLFSQLQQKAEREHLLNQLSQALNSSLDADHILQAIVDQTGQGFGVDRVVIFIMGDEIRALNEWRVDPSLPTMTNYRCAIADWPDLLDPNSDFNQGRAFYCLDLSQEATTPARRQYVEEMQVRSLLSVPIMIRDQMFGSLSISTTTCYRTFSEDEIQLLHQIAAHAAIALTNAQSYATLEQLVQQRTQELEQEKRISEAANRAKSEFLATMSHELRTPLNAILGLSQILHQQIFGSLTPKQLEYITHIHSSGEHLLMLINDILDLAKVESGRETIAPCQLSVHEVCDYCLALVREQAFKQGLQLHSQIDPAVQYCDADERRLKQMLLNLLSNAVKFTPSGSVTLRVEAISTQPSGQPSGSQGITFSVQDTGIGIPADKLPLLFQPFSQLDSQLNRRYDGTGLGLALTRKLARLHGGDVTVTSVPNQGSTFTLYLPHHGEPSAPLPALEGEVPHVVSFTHPHKGRILIVEDDTVNALLLQDYLKSIGYQVLHLADADCFLSTVQDFQPNLILMDVQLSDMVTGIDLLRQLHEQTETPAPPVVIVTAMAMAGDRETFLQAGASAYLSKPINIIKLESVLMDYLAG